MAPETYNFDTEKENIRDFLKTFYYDSEDGGKNFPYVEQIERIAEREQVISLCITNYYFITIQWLLQKDRNNSVKWSRSGCSSIWMMCLTMIQH